MNQRSHPLTHSQVGFILYTASDRGPGIQTRPILWGEGGIKKDAASEIS